MNKQRPIDGTIKRSTLEPKMRNLRGAQNALTRVTITSTTTSTAGAVLFRYEATTAQTLTSERESYNYLALDFPISIVANAEVAVTPWSWTSGTTREVVVAVAVAVTANRMERHVLAVRVNGRDVASSHYMGDSGTMTLVIDLNVTAGDVVTVEYRGYNPLGCPHSMTIDEAEIVVSAR